MIVSVSVNLLHYCLEKAARTVLELGRGTCMAKVDIRNAYRNIFVQPDDRWRLGMSWRGGIFIDAVLPFGLRSAPKIFNSVADALEWIVGNAGVNKVFHYLDDFLVLGATRSEECACRWSHHLAGPDFVAWFPSSHRESGGANN